MTDTEEDVPYGEDFHDPAVASAWAEAAMRKRPWRATIFQHFVAIVNAAPIAPARVLELGSGPGFLAEQLLTHCPKIEHYALLDFSGPMLDHSQRRLANYQGRPEFCVRTSERRIGQALSVHKSILSCHFKRCTSCAMSATLNACTCSSPRSFDRALK